MSERKSSATGKPALENNQVKLVINFENGQLLSDRLETLPAWSEKFGSQQSASIETDADFALDIMYTDWQAPEKANNADNPTFLTKKDFDLVSTSNGNDSLILFFKSKESTIDLRMTYYLAPNDFYIRRSVAVRDTAFGHHFLRWIWARKGSVNGFASVVKAGDFGQPIAMLVNNGGAFFGLEYPTSENKFDSLQKGKVT